MYVYGALQLGLSDLNLVYACSRDKTLMIDVQAREISERDLQAGMKLAHSEVFSFVLCFLKYWLPYSHMFIIMLRQLNVSTLK
jgi:polyribonucleotide nucleotidyltransferase